MRPARLRLMHWCRHRAFGRRLIAGAALAAYLVATVGVPLPKIAIKRSGAPFPCQDHVCGCQTAEECWEHCCCYSPAEKLAWAHRHGVQPPAALAAQVAAWESLAVAGGHAEHQRACCAKHDHNAAADSHEDHHPASCEQCEDGDHGSVGIVLAMGPLARQCKGLVDFWCLSGAVLPPGPAVGWNFQWVVVEWLVPESSLFDSRDLAPPVPPPRV